MSGIFSFIKHPMAHMLQVSGNLVPGIEKAISLYYNSSSQEIKGEIFHSPSNNSSIEPLYIENSDVINDLRTQSRSYSWLTASNLPFETVNNQKIQLDIFDEHENVVLCLSFKNPDDNNFDLLFLYLNHNKGNFGLASSEIPLTTDEKSIIGKLTHNSLSAIYKQQLLDRVILQESNIRLKSLHSDNEKLKAEIERLNTEFNSTKITTCRNQLIKISQEYNTNIDFSNDAIEKILSYTGSTDILINQIKISAINAINSNFGMTPASIIINEFDLVLNPELNSPKLQPELISERYHKTLQLLDKLEFAAKVVLNNNKKLTSENVGNACPIPISAPAISDALKNHHKKVLNLMNEYPERWPLIKNEFRPIKNILWGNTG